MADEWLLSNLRDRFSRFPKQDGELCISIKLRDKNNPYGWDDLYSEIHELLQRGQDRRGIPSEEWFFERHESGPEIITVIGAGLSLAAGIVSLLTAIISLSSQKQTKGRPPAELELSVRGFSWNDEFFDQVITGINLNHALSAGALNKKIAEALNTKCQLVSPKPEQSEPEKKVVKTTKKVEKETTKSNGLKAFKKVAKRPVKKSRGKAVPKSRRKKQ
jgi:hypothetical protein